MRLRFFLARIVWTAFVLLGSSVVIFGLIHLVPGDPARATLGPNGSPAAIAALHTRLGLDQPVPYQYYLWLGHALHGDFGTSILLNQSVGSLLGERLPVTLLLGTYALLFALVLSIPASVISATRKNTASDYLSRLVALLGVAMPSFWVGLMLILLFAVYLQLLPAFGYAPPTPDLWSHFRHMVLPSIALGASYAALVFEMNRSSLIEVLQQDYVRTARASGIAERLVIFKYAMRNALIPTITVIGIQVGFLMSGAVLVEAVFAIPGMGRLLIDAVLARDYPVVQGVMLVTVLIFVVANLAVDGLYAVIDPRIRRRNA
jgi:peptide/nickel transport system permease protein